jgi:hypothetical protein
MTLQRRRADHQELSLSSDKEISRRLHRLADQIGDAPSELPDRFDKFMVIHDELLEIAHELRQQIGESD